MVSTSGAHNMQVHADLLKEDHQSIGSRICGCVALLLSSGIRCGSRGKASQNSSSTLGRRWLNCGVFRLSERAPEPRAHAHFFPESAPPSRPTSPDRTSGHFAGLAAKCRASPTRPHSRPTCGGPLWQRGFIRNATDSAEGELPTAPRPPSLKSPSWGGKPRDQWIDRNSAELRTWWAQSKPSQHSLSRP